MAAKPKPSVEKLAEEYKSVRKDITEKDEIQRKLMAKLYGINLKLKEMIAERSQLMQKFERTNADVKKAARETVLLQNRIDHLKATLQKKLRYIYLMKRQGILQFLFSSSSGHDFDKHMIYLKKFSEMDLKLISQYKLNRKELEEKKKRLKKEVLKLHQAKSKLQKQEKLVAQEQKQKIRWIRGIRKRKSAQIFKIKKLLKSKKKSLDQETFAKIFRPMFIEQKGKLNHPVMAPVVKHYGFFEEPGYFYQFFHKGLRYGCAEGVDVQAVYEGEVAFAGFVNGYGNLVILDHSDHYYSVYSNIRSFKVKTGDKVTTRQSLAETGVSMGGEPGLYFEIRHFSDSVNPKYWLTKQRTRLSELTKEKKIKL